MRAQCLLLGVLFGACSNTAKVEKCHPDVGSVGGGEDVRLEGSGFVSGATVSFGRKPAKVGSVQSETIEVKTPSSNQIGPVDIIVTLPDGRTLVLKNGFAYQESRVLPEGVRK